MLSDCRQIQFGPLYFLQLLVHSLYIAYHSFFILLNNIFSLSFLHRVVVSMTVGIPIVITSTAMRLN
jgi:hypothetical protein